MSLLGWAVHECEVGRREDGKVITERTFRLRGCFSSKFGQVCQAINIHPLKIVIEILRVYT